MNPAIAVLLCVAYGLGLVAAIVPWGGFVVLGIAILAGLIIPRFWRTGPKLSVWFIAGLVGLVASGYCQIRTPHPGGHDVSRFIPTTDIPTPKVIGKKPVITVQGRVETIPRETRSQKAQLWLKATQINPGDDPTTTQSVTGRLYVTVPLLQATGIYPGQAIAITGNLYQPQPATNPGGFDFQAYLAQEGSFAGFKGDQITILTSKKPSGWEWWAIRQRMIQAQMRWLGSPTGQLVSSMVLGSRAVDLPYDLKDQFARIGLAHALAASGFQTSLILGVVLTLTRRFSKQVQFAVGLSALALFVGLAGFQPAVLRAAVMGGATLIGLVLERKVKPLGSLLLAATVLLIINPLWISDLGFQLSFLATMGLLVTASPIMQRLDWLPPAIATALAVPVAAYIWTLPLQLSAFGTLSPYSIPVNLITTPLISLISIVGIVSGLLALISPLAGSASAAILYYPTQALLKIVEFCSQLPGNAIAVGTISLLAAISLYGLISLVWLQPWWRRYWGLGVILGIGLVLVPIAQAQATLFRGVVLATPGTPVLIVQDQGRVTVINSGDEQTAALTVLPFLQQHGINRIDAAIATVASEQARSGWLKLLERLPITTFYDAIPGNPDSVTSAIQQHKSHYVSLSTDQPTHLGRLHMQLLQNQPAIAQFQLGNQAWLWIGKLQPAEQKSIIKAGTLPGSQVLWWSGHQLMPEFVQATQAKVAIATSNTVDPDTLAYLEQQKIPLYWTGRDGAIQWTPQTGLETMLGMGETSPSAL